MKGVSTESLAVHWGPTSLVDSEPQFFCPLRLESVEFSAKLFAVSAAAFCSVYQNLTPCTHRLIHRCFKGKFCERGLTSLWSPVDQDFVLSSPGCPCSPGLPCLCQQPYGPLLPIQPVCPQQAPNAPRRRRTDSCTRGLTGLVSPRCPGLRYPPKLSPNGGGHVASSGHYWYFQQKV